MSDPVKLQSGVRQGCPLSPLLYTIFAETLSNAIRKDQHITGIKIPGAEKESKIVQYADDSTLTLHDDVSVVRAFDIISRFEAASGSELNMTKTEGIYVGQRAGQKHGPIPITWREHSIEILGTRMGNDTVQNWEEKVDKVERKLERWKKRDLTLAGRVVLVKAYALSTIMYLLTVFVMPNDVMTRLNRIIFSFLWKGRNELVARKTCQLAKTEGGLGIPDLKASNIASKTKWIKEITNKNIQKPWVHFARYWLGIPLSTIRDDWIWLRASLKPHGGYNRMPEWYSIVKNTVKKLKEDIKEMKNQQMTAANFTALVKDTTEKPRAEKKWRRLTNAPIDFSPIWSNIWKGLSSNEDKETLWKLTHRVLPTRAYLREWGMKNTTRCPFCTATEDIYHALTGCRRIQRTWEEITKIIESIVGKKIKMTMKTIVFSEGLPSNKTEKELTRFIIETTIGLIWKKRNKKVYGMITRKEDLHNVIKQKIRDRINIDIQNNRITRIRDIWAYKNILCHYDENTGKVNMIV